jgi:hypothetical protein
MERGSRSEKLEKDGDRQKKMEGHCSTGKVHSGLWWQWRRRRTKKRKRTKKKKRRLKPGQLSHPGSIPGKGTTFSIIRSVKTGPGSHPPTQSPPLNG